MYIFVFMFIMYIYIARYIDRYSKALYGERPCERGILERRRVLARYSKAGILEYHGVTVKC